MPGTRPDSPVMMWTVLPAQAIAQAWVDDDFAARLLADTPSALSKMVTSISVPASVRAIADTPEVRYLPLPQRPPSLSDSELVAQVWEEVGKDESYEWMLPADVIARASTDEPYRRALIDSPASVGVPEGIVVLENDTDTHWLVLPLSPSSVLPSPAEVTERLREIFGGVTMSSTTKCCATGTCE